MDSLPTTQNSTAGSPHGGRTLNIITDVHLTPGNVHDSVPYLGRLDRQAERLGFEIRSVGLEAGYFTAGICKGLEERDICGVIGYRRPTRRKGYFYKREYRYDAEQDRYTRPEGAALIYKTTDRNGYRHYRYARFRGLKRMKAQYLLAAAAQNIKKIALLRG
ncbi:MAG: transposase [Oceanospirillaceae bacterium]|nr:transposase [Oceanospirillaceae bacterium]